MNPIREAAIANAASIRLNSQIRTTPIRYRGRELRQPQVGHDLMDEIAERVSEHAEVVRRQRQLDGRQLSMMLSPT